MLLSKAGCGDEACVPVSESCDWRRSSFCEGHPNYSRLWESTNVFKTLRAIPASASVQRWMWWWGLCSSFRKLWQEIQLHPNSSRLWESINVFGTLRAIPAVVFVRSLVWWWGLCSVFQKTMPTEASVSDVTQTLRGYEEEPMYYRNLRAIPASVFVHSMKCVPCLR